MRVTLDSWSLTAAVATRKLDIEAVSSIPESHRGGVGGDQLHCIPAAVDLEVCSKHRTIADRFNLRALARIVIEESEVG